MRPVYLNFLVVLLIGIAPAGAALAADPISTWVDDQGVRHFSQYPPANPGVDFAMFELEPLPPAVPLTDRLEAIRAVTRELELSRQARAEARAESRAAAAAAEETPAPVTAAPDRQVIFLPYPYRHRYPAYPYRHFRDDIPPEPNEHRPRQPGARVFSPP